MALILDVWRFFILVGCTVVIAMLVRVVRLRRGSLKHPRLLAPSHTAWAWIFLVLYIAFSISSRFGSDDLTWRSPLATVAIGWSIYSLHTLIWFFEGAVDE